MATSDNSKALPAINAKVKFGENTFVDGYLLESGEIRYSKTGTSELLAHAKSWINGFSSEAPEAFKLLQCKGFNGFSQRVSVKREGRRGATIAETISGDDLDILIEFEAERGNKKAIALLTAGWRQYRIDQSRHAFGLEERTQEEKLESFDDWVEARMANDEDWDAIAEQEHFSYSGNIIMFDGSEYIQFSLRDESTASNYFDDPDCHQVRRRVD